MGKEITILAGDIGASKTIFALYSSALGLGSPLKEKTYNSAECSGIMALLDDFLGDVDSPLHSIALGVAGPVLGQKAQITKLPWAVDSRAIQKYLQIPNVFVLNDLVANVYGLAGLRADDFVSLNDSAVALEAPKAMLSPGTGLGEAFFIDGPSGRQVFGSEGGHCHFAPVNQEQGELLAFYQTAQNTITFDTFCGGDGFMKIYSFLKTLPQYAESADHKEALETAAHPAALITKNALSSAGGARCPLCVHTVELYVEILASEAANMVLKMLACGGLYLGGGIPPKILPYLQTKFMPRFTTHQSMGHILSKVPVYVVREAKTALYGAGRYALEQAA